MFAAHLVDGLEYVEYVSLHFARLVVADTDLIECLHNVVELRNGHKVR